MRIDNRVWKSAAATCAAWLILGASAVGTASAQNAPVAAGDSTGRATAAVLYTKDNAPAAPRLEDLPLKGSVSQYGITWTFEKPARVGQFVNGDYYVVGAVTVTGTDPKPLFGEEVPAAEINAREKRYWAGRYVRNGSMLNPPAKQEVGFDSGVRNWSEPNLAARFPVSMGPGDSLASSVSIKPGEKVVGPYHSRGMRGEQEIYPIRTVAILTCVKEPLPPDAFRPGFCDRQQTIWLSRDLKRQLLPRLEKVKGTPDIALWARIFQRPWYNIGIFAYDHPCENMPHYAQWLGQAMSDGGCMLCLDFTPQQKEPLLVNMVQVGIDYYGLVRAGHPGWAAWGGHGSGRKFPIVLAGMMLGDEEMAQVSKHYPKTSFGEDEQTAYGDCWTGAKVVFTGHSGIDAATGKSRDYVRAGSAWGCYEHLHPSKWVKDEFQSEAYRRANTTRAWMGEALAMRILKGESAWGHDAFFDYVDRWMFEDDAQHRKEMDPYWPYASDGRPLSNKFFRQGDNASAFSREMWEKYRKTLPQPTDGWKRKHDDSYYRSALKTQPPIKPDPPKEPKTQAATVPAPVK